MSVTMICDRCRQPVDELYQTSLCFTEMVVGEVKDGNFSDLEVHLCELCTYAAEDWLAKECGREPLKREKPAPTEGDGR